MLDWVKTAWESISRELIQKSFKTCGLTIASDGSDDAQIHCLKPDQPCFPALEILKTARATEQFEFLQISDDEDEADHNEALIDDSDLENE